MFVDIEMFIDGGVSICNLEFYIFEIDEKQKNNYLGDEWINGTNEREDVDVVDVVVVVDVKDDTADIEFDNECWRFKVCSIDRTELAGVSEFGEFSPEPCGDVDDVDVDVDDATRELANIECCADVEVDVGDAIGNDVDELDGVVTGQCRSAIRKFHKLSLFCKIEEKTRHVMFR